MSPNKQKTLYVVLLLLLISILASSQVYAQEEEQTGFTEDFDNINWEEWEYSQDVLVENGILRLGPGNFIMRLGGWSEIDLTIQMRYQTPNEAVVNYYMNEGGHYALILIGDRVILEKIAEGEPSHLGEGPVADFTSEEWNEIKIQVAGGTHTISINQTQVLTVTDTEPYTGGDVMIHSLGSATVEVDSINLTGSPLGEATPAGEAPPEEMPPGEEPPGEQPPAEEPAGEPGAEPAVSPGLPTDTGADTTLTLIEELLAGQSNQLELTTFLINLILAVVSSFILGRVYVYWGSSLSNRRAFASNFMLLTVTTTFIILVVRSSVALSLGLVGALSIVRFRAAIKEPEELAYLFFAISLGIGLGDNQRLITLLALVVAIVIMGLLRLFRNTQSDVNLHLTVSSHNPEKVDLDEITAVLEKHCSKIKLLRFDETAEVLESSYVIEFKRLSNLSQAKSELQALSPAMQISFLDNKGIW